MGLGFTANSAKIGVPSSFGAASLKSAPTEFSQLEGRLYPLPKRLLKSQPSSPAPLTGLTRRGEVSPERPARVFVGSRPAARMTRVLRSAPRLSGAPTAPTSPSE